ncbi:MAG: response regulator transcription factor [Chitinophagaceae bacterium]|nr:response regulator transcription factor [Chitinophagaceae bacterium]
MIKIALVDDHAVTRRGIKAILESAGDIKVVLEASDGLELIKTLETGIVLPQLLILDISMPSMNGYDTVDAVKRIYPDIQVLIFSLLSEEDSILNMITRGACGYISKSADPLVLVEAVKAIHEKGFYLPDWLKKRYFDQQNSGEKRPGFYGRNFLTAKELAFIRLACSNLTYHEIAEQLNVRPRTVENYRDNLFEKLGINNRAALAVYAFRNGIVPILP